MRRELVIGASGLIGSYLVRDAKQAGAAVTGTYCTQRMPGLRRLDITAERAVAEVLEHVQPSVVYLPAARPGVDWVEEHPEESASVNVTAPLRIIRLLEGTDGTLVYYSSDYVFDGRDGPYVEADEPNPVNEYGRQKLAVERAIKERLGNWLILRVTVVYGWERRRKNFVHRAMCHLRSGGVLEVPADQFGNPTYAPDLASASRDLVGRNARGLFHLAGEARASRYELALEMARVFGLPCDRIRPVATSSLQQRAKRPMNAGMIGTKAQDVLGAPLLGYPEGLRRMREQRGMRRGDCD